MDILQPGPQELLWPGSRFRGRPELRAATLMRVGLTALPRIRGISAIRTRIAAWAASIRTGYLSARRQSSARLRRKGA